MAATARAIDDTRPRWRLHSAQYEAFASKARTRCVVAGRRWGKSELAVMWQLAKAQDDRLRGRPRVHWWVAPTYPLTRPIWRKFLRLAPPGWITATHGTEGAPDFLEIGAARIEFKSGDHPERLVAEGLGSVVIDECGTIRESVWSESIMPALMDYQADALLGGTPKGRNWFYRMWMRGKDDEDREVESFGGPSFQNPFIAREEVERLASEMPQRLYRQEILAEFLDDEGAVFRGVRDCVKPRSTEPTAALGVDLAKHEDFTVIVGVDRRGCWTSFDRFREISWPLQKERIKAAAAGGTRVLLDSTGIGDPILDDLQKLGVNVEGYKFTSASKQQLIESLAMAIEERRIGLPDDPVVLNELEAYEYETTAMGRTRYSAPEGAHDDCVIAVALAHRAISAPGAIDYEAFVRA